MFCRFLHLGMLLGLLVSHAQGIEPTHDVRCYLDATAAEFKQGDKEAVANALALFQNVTELDAKSKSQLCDGGAYFFGEVWDVNKTCTSGTWDNGNDTAANEVLAALGVASSKTEDSNYLGGSCMSPHHARQHSKERGWKNSFRFVILADIGYKLIDLKKLCHKTPHELLRCMNKFFGQIKTILTSGKSTETIRQSPLLRQAETLNPKEFTNKQLPSYSDLVNCYCADLPPATTKPTTTPNPPPTIDDFEFEQTLLNVAIPDGTNITTNSSAAESKMSEHGVLRMYLWMIATAMLIASFGVVSALALKWYLDTAT